MSNLFDISGLKPDKGEQFETILDSGFGNGGCGLMLERVVSFGNATPDGEWYDQDWTEWVMVAKGSATLEFDNARVLEMKEGDWMVLKPGEKHKVAKVSDDCVWLALHYR